MQKILFATDFSDSSRTALHFLKLLKFKTDYLLIHVIPSFWKNWFVSGLYQKEAEQRLQSWQQELTGKIDKRKLFVKIGNRADLILSTSETSQTNLIVLGSKSEKLKGRYRSGATVGSVVRNSRKSVLICKREKISKILCGIDGSPSSTNVLNCAIEWAKHFNAGLSVLFVLPKLSINLLGMDENEILAEEKKVKTENFKKIEEFFKKFDFANLKVEKHFKSGIPSHVLLDMAEDYDFDLITIGAKGHSKLHYVLMGSTAEKVLRYAPCSLLVVR